VNFSKILFIVFIDQAVTMVIANKNTIVAVVAIMAFFCLAIIAIVAISIGGGDSDVTTTTGKVLYAT
jgi:hypothetical protein